MNTDQFGMPKEKSGWDRFWINVMRYWFVFVGFLCLLCGVTALLALPILVSLITGPK